MRVVKKRWWRKWARVTLAVGFVVAIVSVFVVVAIFVFRVTIWGKRDWWFQLASSVIDFIGQKGKGIGV